MAGNGEKSLGGNNARVMLMHMVEEGTEVEGLPSAPGQGGEGLLERRVRCWPRRP